MHNAMYKQPPLFGGFFAEKNKENHDGTMVLRR